MAAPRDPTLRLHDILDAIVGVRAVLGAASYSQYLDDQAMRWAVERGIEIISEASRHIPPEIKALEPDVDWRRAAGIGNILRHDYAHIADDSIYTTARERLPQLEAAVRRLLARLEG